MSRRSSAVRSQLLFDSSETDLIKLQQLYRRAENDKQAYREKTQGLISRHKREIQRLQEEHEKLLRSLRVSQSCSKRRTDASVVQDPAAKLACRDRVDEELEAEKGKVAFLKDEILKWERKLVRWRTDGGTIRHSMKSANSNLLKRTYSIENKLYTGCKYFNKVMARNGELREELMSLQTEKKQFLHLQSQLEKELHTISKDIYKLRTTCTEAFNASVKIQEKQRMLRDQNAKDVSQYIKEKGNLEREIAHSCYFGGFLEIKAIPRNNQNINQRKVDKCKQSASKELELQDFEDVIKQILRETEETDLDKLIRTFIQMEEQNYTLLNFVNYQRNEVEAIRRQISQLCSETEIFVAEEQRQQEQHQALQITVSMKQEATEQQLAVHLQRVDFMEKLLNRLKEGVKSLLQISCNTLVIRDQLGSSDRVQDENTEYLRMVEDRVNELVTLQSFLHFQEKLCQWDDSLSTLAGQLLGIIPPAVNLTPAAVTPAPDDDPDLVKSVLLDAKEPVSREDLLTLLNKMIQRKTDVRLT